MTDIKENTSWHGLSLNTIYNIDCIEGMKLIPDWSIDCIITDPPYWSTACRWDHVIPFEPMWEQLNRIIKPNGAIVLFWSEPFSSALRMSNIKNYKYDWDWNKKIPSGMAYAKYRPMQQTERISVFTKDGSKTIYNKQMILREKPIKGGGMSKGETTNNQNLKALKKTYTHKNPTTLLEFDKIRKGSLHPTQKPVALIEYLVKTYTNEWETVLDFTMGSGTTAIAAINTNRNYIWFELDEWYRNIANKRIQDRLSEKPLFS